MPWNDKTPHQPVPWPHGRKPKSTKGRKKGPLINRPPKLDAA